MEDRRPKKEGDTLKEKLRKGALSVFQTWKKKAKPSAGAENEVTIPEAHTPQNQRVSPISRLQALQSEGFADDELDDLRDVSQRGKPFVKHEHSGEGSPTEERQPFPSLNELRPVLPNKRPVLSRRATRNFKNLSMTAAGEIGYAHWQNQQQGEVPAPVTENLWEPQEQAEPVHHAASNSSASTADHSTVSTRIPHPPDTFSRQPIPEQAITGREVDVQDSALVTDVQVNLELKRRLQSDGCFLDPEKYDPVKFLGSGGYSKETTQRSERVDHAALSSAVSY